MVKKKKFWMSVCIIAVLLIVLAVGAGIFAYKSKGSPEDTKALDKITNVFDEMIEKRYMVMEEAEHITAGGYDALRLSWPVKESTPLRIGIIYSMEYKRLYIYGDACMPEEIQDMSYQEYFEECLEEYGITWEEVEDSKEDFICKNILEEWFIKHESQFSKDKLGELEVLDFLMPYEYCGKDNSNWKTVTEIVEEGYRGAFQGKMQYTVWDAGDIQCRQTQQSRDYGYHDIMERIEADMNGFNTVSEEIKVEWDWRWKENNEEDQEYASLGDIFYLRGSDFVDWLQTSGKVEGNLTKLSYTREEGEAKTREMIEQCPKGKLFRLIEAADYYIAGDELNMRLAYYDYEAENPDWLENGKGEIWQGWITVKIDDIWEFWYYGGSDYFIEKPMKGSGILPGIYILEADCFEKVMEEKRVTENYCGMDEFEELNYYLFCNTQIHEDAGGFTYKPAIINSETQTIEEAKELYQSFMERLSIDYEEEGESEIIYVSYVSPDCKWVIKNKWNEFRTIKTQILFCEKEKVKEKVNEIRVENNPILIVKDGDSYREIDEEHYERLLELEKESYVHEGYSSIWKINAEGNLLAGIRDEYGLLTIKEIEKGAEKWSFSLQGIQEEVAHIRDDVQEGDTVFVSIQQFEGDEKEGWLTVQAGQSSFFRIAYPSGEVTYLGEYMYDVCFSPDGKYVAYSSVDYDNGVDMVPEEYERLKKTCPLGIYVREIETGKTAYIYWDTNRNPEEDYMEYRHFMWIEKEGFEEFMEEL